MRHNNKTFFNEKIALDGNEYYGCTFQHCEVIIRAEHPISMADCLFTESRFVFGGAATTTVKFLTAMYHNMGEPGRIMVERLFEEIRQNKAV